MSSSNKFQDLVSKAYVVGKQFIELVLLQFQDNDVGLGDQQIRIDKIRQPQHFADKLALCKL